MRAGRIHRFGPPEVIAIDEIPRPAPGEGEVLVRTAVAGVGPWDALIREKKSVVDVPLPITLGSDLSGVVEAVGPGITQFHADDEVYGVTNKNFCGAYAEFAVAAVQGIAPKPRSLSFAQAGGAPVVAVTAWQMLFDYARMKAGQTVLIHGAAGNVGAYAVQLGVRNCASSRPPVPPISNMSASWAPIPSSITGRSVSTLLCHLLTLSSIWWAARLRSAPSAC